MSTNGAGERGADESDSRRASEAPSTSEPLSRREPEDMEPRCDLCGAPMLERHCKLVCVQCGYQRDCSDP